MIGPAAELALARKAAQRIESRVVETVEEWGAALRARRRAARLARSELAQMVNAAESSIGRWERGECAPCGRVVASLARVLPGLPSPPGPDVLSRVAEAARAGMTYLEIGERVLGGRTRQRAQQLVARAAVEGHDVTPPRREPETWGEVLADLRERAGLSQGDLGERVGRCSSTIGGWETGARRPGRDSVDRLREVLPELPPHPRPARPRRGPRPESRRSRVAARLAEGATREEVREEFGLSAHQVAVIACWARGEGILPAVEDETRSRLERVEDLAAEGGIERVAEELGVAPSWARTLVRRARSRES